MPKLFVAAVIVTVAGVLGAVAESASALVVPVHVQQAIKQRVKPGYAYVPTSIPPGYHYLRWMQARRDPTAMTIWFQWHRNRQPVIGFNVSRLGGPYPAKPMKTYRFRGLKVHWGTTYTDAEAWSCIRRGHGWLMLYASAPGYGLKGPSSNALAKVIGSARLR